MRACKGSNHGHFVQCERCSWRYAGRIARRISRATGPFYAVTTKISDPTPSGFRRGRVEVRNRITYLRKAPSWRNFGLHVWRCRDGKVKGIVSLATLGPAEVPDGLTRWPVTLRVINPRHCGLRSTISSSHR
jgi:hypothetical protein